MSKNDPERPAANALRYDALQSKLNLVDHYTFENFFCPPPIGGFLPLRNGHGRDLPVSKSTRLIDICCHL
jgi:hypothetical protein